MSEMVGNEGLSELELLILRSIPHLKDIERLAKTAGVSPATLGREIAKLQISGYIGEDGTITERGLKAIQERPGDVG
jgi:DNA-binding MarR family transcriptional regulator